MSNEYIILHNFVTLVLSFTGELVVYIQKCRLFAQVVINMMVPDFPLRLYFFPYTGKNHGGHDFFHTFSGYKYTCIDVFKNNITKGINVIQALRVFHMLLKRFEQLVALLNLWP